MRDMYLGMDVKDTLCGPLFEPDESVDVKFISYKPTLLLALTSETSGFLWI